ncbi:MAG: hypothetical protein EHM90_00925 [Chloroflexi bacterium]|nr:MAG: hypothetical protein EHM90_00925 [Chloroflexota bacterium]
MVGWLSGGLAAARVASDRAELWFPGALVSFAAAGWLVLLLTVAPPPDAIGAAGLGMQLAGSPWWPWNVVVLGVAIVAGVGTVLLVVAFGEVALFMGLLDPAGTDTPPTVARAMAVLTLAALPVLAAALILGWLAAPAAVDAVLGSDPATPAPVRLLEATWPYLLALAAVVVIVQAVGAAGLRRPGWQGLAAARRSGHRLVPQAAVTLVAFLGAQALTGGMLAVLWHPLADRLADGGLAQPMTVILLLGFVWIWLVLVIICGVVQAWTSAWWQTELGAGSGAKSLEGDP